MAQTLNVFIRPYREAAALPRSALALVAITLVNRVGAMGVPFLVLFLTERRGFTGQTAGLVLSLYGIGALLSTLCAPALVRAVGTARAMSLCLFLAGAAQIAFPLIDGQWAMFTCIAIWALSSEAFRPASFAHVADVVAPAAQRQAFATLRLAVNVGMSIGPALGGFIAARSYTALFVFDGATSILAGILAWRLSGSLGTPPAASERRSRRSNDTRPWVVAAATFAVALVFYQYSSSLPLYLVGELHLPETAYGLTFLLNGVLIVLLELPLNTATAHWTARRQLVIGSLLFGLGFAAYALAHGFATVVLVACLWSFGEMFFFPAAPAYLGATAPSEERAAWQGLYLAAWNAAFVVGPAMGALTLTELGPVAHWLIFGGLGALAAIIVSTLLPAESASMERKTR